jgi:hypothetical protein
MPERTSLTTDATGRRVLAKVAGTADEAARLAREAASLELGRHPGVAELVGVDGHGVGAVLLTTHVDGPTLSEVGLLPLEESAGLLASLATTLADLHDLGLVHGAVCPEHVIIGPAGRPVLCSLGYGGRTGQAPGPAPAQCRVFTDPDRAGADTLDPAFDVFGLGALARALAPDPPPGHVLARVAAEATAGARAERPRARAIADVLQQEVPAARLPRGLMTTEPNPPRPPPRVADPLDTLRQAQGRGHRSRRPGGLRAAAVVPAVIAVALVAAVIVVVGNHAPGPDPDLAAEVAVPPADAPATPADEAPSGPPTTRAGYASPSTTTSPPRRDCPPVTGLLQADTDGDGCPDTLHFADGVLESGGRRWSVGRTGDQVATGDWGCQGTRTLALFRPATGEVFRFDGWAGPGRDLQAAPVAVVMGGQALRAADVDRDGCHEVVVERATGPAEVVRMPHPQP